MKRRERDAVELLALGGQKRHERPARQPGGEALAGGLRRRALAQLDLRQPRVAAEQLRVVRDVVDVRCPQPPDRDHDDLHGCDTNRR